MKSLTKAEIFSRKAPPPEPVEAFGGTVYVKLLSGYERDAVEQAIENGRKKGPVPVRAIWVAAACCDENGKDLFNTMDIPALKNLPGDEMSKLVAAIGRVNKVTPEDVDEVEKKCEPIHENGSATTLPLTLDTPVQS